MEDNSKLIIDFFSELFDEKELKLLNLSNQAKMDEDIIDDIIEQEEE